MFLLALGITTEQLIEHLKKPQRQQMPPLF